MIQHFERWISEKLDGVRAFWDGHRLISRNGNEIACPQWFTQGLPNEALDGELWMGRSSFEELSAVLNTSVIEDTSWKSIKYMVFDSPQSRQPFEARILTLGKLDLPSHVGILHHEQCKGTDHLLDTLQTTISQGGEGLMLNKQNSSYVGERTESLLKVKVFRISLFLFLKTFSQPQSDADVQVLEVIPQGLFCLQ